MLLVAVVMLGILLAAALVVTYVAYPQRGREVPAAPWLGEALDRTASRLGLEDADDERPVERVIR